MNLNLKIFSLIFVLIGVIKGLPLKCEFNQMENSIEILVNKNILSFHPIYDFFKSLGPKRIKDVSGMT